LGWFELSLGAVSIGLAVSVGWPLTSPGFEDIPGSLLGVSLEGLGLAGRDTLPAVPWSVLEEEPALPRVSLAEPLLLEPVSVPEVVGLAGEAGVVGLALVSSEGGVPEGEVPVRCMLLGSLRPCESVFLCFFTFFFVVVVVELEIEESPLELRSWSCGVFAAVSPLPAGELAEGLLLGSVWLVESAFEELPGSALLFWSAGSVAVPFCSVVWVLVVVVVSLVPVPVPVLV
jgi:hypothetical protein